VNLYFVTCVYQRVSGIDTIDVFVVAQDVLQAESAALALMKSLEWKYTDRVESIRLVASVNTHRANNLLVIA